MRAIKTPGIYSGAYDPNDSVGIIDTYFPSSDFFTDSADLSTLSREKIDPKCQWSLSIARPIICMNTT